MLEQEYARLAAIEDSMWYFRALRGHFLDALSALHQGASLLDAGCGTGGLLLNIAASRTDLSLHGIDLSPVALDLSRRRCPAMVQLHSGSMERLPFEDASLDAITASDTLCQIERSEASLAEFRRVLKPEGLLLVNVPAYRWMRSYHDVAVHTVHRYTRPELAGELERTGFRVERVGHWTSFIFPLIFLRRRLLPGHSDGASDVRPYPAPLEFLFRGLASVERSLMRRRIALPFGNSIFCVARG
jgi:SAM-dependent methyltransferase